MKKSFKKIVALFVSAVMTMMTLTVAVSAEEENLHGLSETPPVTESSHSIISTYDWMFPTRVWNLGTSGMYSFSGNAQKTDLFTNYLFTGVNNFAIRVTNNISTDVTVTLYKYDEDALFKSEKVKSFVVKGNVSNSATVIGIDSQSTYYLKFSAPCDISGTIA